MNKQLNNWSTLSGTTKDIINEVMRDTAKNRSGPKSETSFDECISDIEYEDHSGFIAFESNCGGVTYTDFVTLFDYITLGRTPKHTKASEQIKSLLKSSLTMIQGELSEEISETLMKFYFKGDKTKLSFENLSEMEENLRVNTKLQYDAVVVQGYLDRFKDLEHSYLTDEQSTVMHELCFLYHGKDEQGCHTATVSAAVNTEAPYHRKSIPWTPETFCEGGTEIDIKWKNNAELKRKLTKAFNKASEGTF